MVVHNSGTNGETRAMTEAAHKTYETFLDAIAAAQAQNMKLAFGWIGSSVEMFKTQAEINLRVLEAVTEQSRRQQEVSRTLVSESVKTFVDLSYPPLPHAAEPVAEPETDGNGSLPIEDFDRLSVEEIIRRLRGLDAREVEEIKTYEKRHKSREVILERLDRALV